MSLRTPALRMLAGMTSLPKVCISPGGISGTVRTKSCVPLPTFMYSALMSRRGHTPPMAVSGAHFTVMMLRLGCLIQYGSITRMSLARRCSTERFSHGAARFSSARPAHAKQGRPLVASGTWGPLIPLECDGPSCSLSSHLAISNFCWLSCRFAPPST